MTARQGKWWVAVENPSTIEMDEFDFFDACLAYACEKRKIKDYKITVEGPGGMVMTEDELAGCCALANQKIIWA